MTKQERLQALFAQLERDLPSLQLDQLDPHEPLVPGDGTPDSFTVFIGEAPGYYESVQRKPFVGRSGQLLTQTLEAMGMPRSEVYITNIVKLRPPENRDPLPAEILAFRPYLNQEIEIISPRLIVTLGRFSMAKFLPDVRISQVHGRLHKVRWEEKTVYVLPMYHPAAALRNPQTKTAFVADMQKIPKVLAWLADRQIPADENFEDLVKANLL
jgi:DNA polymerase